MRTKKQIEIINCDECRSIIDSTQSVNCSFCKKDFEKECCRDCLEKEFPVIELFFRDKSYYGRVCNQCIENDKFIARVIHLCRLFSGDTKE